MTMQKSYSEELHNAKSRNPKIVKRWKFIFLNCDTSNFRNHKMRGARECGKVSHHDIENCKTPQLFSSEILETKKTRSRKTG